MSLESKEFSVGGVRYRTTVLDAVTGRRLYLRILKAAAPGLKGMADAKDKDTASVMLGLVAEVLGNLDEQLFDDLCDVLGGVSVICQGDKQVKLTGDVFGMHFAGKYEDLTNWLLECLKANKFLDFLSGTFGHASDAPAKV
jgi:hypothetical protein